MRPEQQKDRDWTLSNAAVSAPQAISRTARREAAKVARAVPEPALRSVAYNAACILINRGEPPREQRVVELARKLIATQERRSR